MCVSFILCIILFLLYNYGILWTFYIKFPKQHSLPAWFDHQNLSFLITQPLLVSPSPPCLFLTLPLPFIVSTRVDNLSSHLSAILTLSATWEYSLIYFWQLNDIISTEDLNAKEIVVVAAGYVWVHLENQSYHH